MTYRIFYDHLKLSAVNFEWSKSAQSHGFVDFQRDCGKILSMNLLKTLSKIFDMEGGS